jgi:agmatine deiminase
MERYQETCKNLIKILEKHNIKYSFIKGTKDIWCRDYMPIQTESGKLIQFKYDPSYLKGQKEWEESRSDVKDICKQNNIIATSSDINLDGGNVLICDGRAIISDRIYSENPDKTREELRKELAMLLECEIIVIPSLNKTADFTGHADGMVRFVDRNTVLGIKYDDRYKKDWWKNTQKVLDTYNISFIEVPFFEDEPDSEHPESAIGVYVNYLEVNDLIVVPVFGREEDARAIEIIQKAFPNKQIETINYNDVAKEGGLLNCTTWVVK